MIPLRDNVPRSTWPFITATIIAVNCFVFFLELSAGPAQRDQLIATYAMIPARSTAFVTGLPVGFAGGVLTLFTSMFLHANPAHLGGNLLFLLIFGTSLEERVSRKKWLVTYFASGLAGNIAFLFLGGNAVGVGASGAIWGLLAAAGGLRGLFGMLFYIGLNIFSGGGFLAHAGGLAAVLALHYLWLNKPQAGKVG